MSSVYNDYQKGSFDRYFTMNFMRRHLRPGTHLQIGGFQASRARARAGNLAHNYRAQQGENVDVNSIIYDVDPTRKLRQVLHLMLEVEERNASGEYTKNAGAVQFLTKVSYYIHSTASGSRQNLEYAPFWYAVIPAIPGRWIINHYGGVLVE